MAKSYCTVIWTFIIWSPVFIKKIVLPFYPFLHLYAIGLQSALLPCVIYPGPWRKVTALIDDSSSGSANLVLCLSADKGKTEISKIANNIHRVSRST